MKKKPSFSPHRLDRIAGAAGQAGDYAVVALARIAGGAPRSDLTVWQREALRRAGITRVRAAGAAAELEFLGFGPEVGE